MAASYAANVPMAVLASLARTVPPGFVLPACVSAVTMSALMAMKLMSTVVVHVAHCARKGIHAPQALIAGLVTVRACQAQEA